MTNKKPKFNHSELATVIAEEFKLTKKNALAIIKHLTQSIVEKASDPNYDGVQIHEFGVFRVKEASACKRRNPQTGEMIDVPAKKRLVFKQSSTVRESI